MKIRIRYFASLREALGASEEYDLPDGGLTVGMLRDRLAPGIACKRAGPQPSAACGSTCR